MNRESFTYLAFLPSLLAGLCSSAASAQQYPPGYLDPKPVLKAATDAIGADKIRCLSASGTITGSRVGQQRIIQVEGDWPDDKLENFVRYMNWEGGAMREQFDRAPGLTPASYKYGVGWTGGTPTQRHPRQTFAVNGKVAWSQDGPESTPVAAQPELADKWQLDLWLNPVGFLKAAAKPGADPIATWRWELGEMGRDGPTTVPEKVTVVSIKIGGHRVDATINKENMIQRLHTTVANPVLGDFNVEQEFTNDKFVDLGNGMKFPTKWHSHQGYDDNYGAQTVSSGHNAFDGNLENIKVNECTDTVAVPSGLQPAADVTRVETQKLADGVYLLGGASHNSVAVEFKDYIAVVEAPLNEERSLAVIEEIVKLIPDKPIRFVVNTHQHFDHIGGLRTYLHIGATAITHIKNFDFYNNDVLNYAPRVVEPDLVSMMPPTELAEGYNLETIRENFTLTDGKRILNVNYVHPLKHADGMLMVYLPVERLLIEGDLVDTHEPLASTPTDGAKILHRMVDTLKYDVDRIVPIHGQPITWSEFVSKTNVGKQAAVQ